jgi:hypothetical protein
MTPITVSTARALFGAHALILFDQAGWHTTRKLKIPKNLTMVRLPPACPELKCSRKHLAIPPPELSVEPRVRRPLGHPRRLSKSLAQAPQRARPHRIHRNPAIGPSSVNHCEGWL